MLDVKKLTTKILDTLEELSYTNFENAYLDYCKVKRVGNVVNVWGISTGGFNVPAGSYKALTTLPTWARPDHEVVDTVEAFGSASTEISIQIRTDGIVNLYCTTTASWWRYNVTYII